MMTTPLESVEIEKDVPHTVPQYFVNESGLQVCATTGTLIAVDHSDYPDPYLGYYGA